VGRGKRWGRWNREAGRLRNERRPPSGGRAPGHLGAMVDTHGEGVRVSENASQASAFSQYELSTSGLATLRGPAKRYTSDLRKGQGDTMLRHFAKPLYDEEEAWFGPQEGGLVNKAWAALMILLGTSVMACSSDTGGPPSNTGPVMSVTLGETVRAGDWELSVVDVRLQGKSVLPESIGEADSGSTSASPKLAVGEWLGVDVELINTGKESARLSGSDFRVLSTDDRKFDVLHTSAGDFVRGGFAFSRAIIPGTKVHATLLTDVPTGARGLQLEFRPPGAPSARVSLDTGPRSSPNLTGLPSPTAPADSPSLTTAPPQQTSVPRLPTQTVTVAEVVTVTPRAAPIATPTASCATLPDPRFVSAYGSVQNRLGCATSVATPDFYAEQRFEGGFTIWLESRRLIHVFLNSGTWTTYPDTWSTSQPEVTCTDPGNSIQPIRGFGKLWCESRAVRSTLGKPLEYEYGNTVPVQRFQGGFVFLRERRQQVIKVFSNGTWN